MLRYDSIAHNTHATHVTKKDRGLSLETATTITMWTTIVAFVLMVATLALVAYNAFQLSKPNDTYCTFEEYSNLPWVTLPSHVATKIPTLLIKESSDSPIKKGSKTIPSTQKTSCAEKMHHAALDNTESNSNSDESQPNIPQCSSSSTTTTPAFFFEERQIGEWESNDKAVTTTSSTFATSLKQITVPTDDDEFVCMIELSFDRVNRVMFYSNDDHDEMSWVRRSSTDSTIFKFSRQFIVFYESNTAIAYVELKTNLYESFEFGIVYGGGMKFLFSTVQDLMNPSPTFSASDTTSIILRDNKLSGIAQVGALMIQYANVTISNDDHTQSWNQPMIQYTSTGTVQAVLAKD